MGKFWHSSTSCRGYNSYLHLFHNTKYRDGPSFNEQKVRPFIKLRTIAAAEVFQLSTSKAHPLLSAVEPLGHALSSHQKQHSLELDQAPKGFKIACTPGAYWDRISQPNVPHRVVVRIKRDSPTSGQSNRQASNNCLGTGMIGATRAKLSPEKLPCHS